MFNQAYLFRISICTLVIGLFFSGVSLAQSNDPILFSFDDEEVHLSEFNYVYNKNNVNDENAYSRESLEEYLELYINFRLKVKQAEEIQLDTIQALTDELETYRKQLAKSYLFDKQVTEKLLKEAYQRMQWDVNASHILVKIDEPGLPADTLEAYDKITTLRGKLINGANFEEVAKEYSEDPSADENSGEIGYFSVFNTIYPFETAAYNLKVGELSEPVRTRFGYHLVKVNDRRESLGKVTVAHILITVPENPTAEQEKNLEKKALEVYNKAISGESFDGLVSKYSDDKYSAKKGGVLSEFGAGRMVKPFEDAAFGLEYDGAISRPVKSKFGWHIIKRINKKGIPTYKEAEEDLRTRVSRDARSQAAKSELVEQLKKEYGFKEYSKNVEGLYNRIGERLPQGKFVMSEYDDLDKPLFKIADFEVKQKDFVEYLEATQKKKRNEPSEKVYGDFYHTFTEKTVLDYEESQLERKFPDFKSLMREYRDGILLFELTDNKVWSKAIEDSTGLAEFHKQNQMKYMWDKRVEAEVYTAVNTELAEEAAKLAKKGKLSSEQILAKLKDDDNPRALKVESVRVEKGQNGVIDAVAWETGVSEFIENKDGTITFVKIKAVLPPMPKTLNEAKGFIVSDYQSHLEAEWVKSLRNKYDIKVNKAILETLIK